MAEHRHRFRRLSDTAIFCECGETRVVAAPSVVYSPPVITVPPVVVPKPDGGWVPPWRYPNTTTPDTTIRGGSTTFDMTGITVWNRA